MSDIITGLNDRQEFFKALHANVIRANENGGKLALLIIQINRFQRINEVNGYDGGDAALNYVGHKLTEIKRDQDFIARISDTKFALLLNKILNKGHAQLAAHKVVRVLEVPLEHKDKQIRISVTIGIALCPSHSSVPIGLYKKSEEALKLAKLHEKPIGISPDNTGFEISDFWDIELGIEQALNESQFQLYYQPKLSLKTGQPVGAEALIRWPHPSRGMIRPDQFIPIAEQYNYIKPITIWILNVALRESSEWTDQWGPLSISANIPPELMDSELVDLVDNALNIWEPENVTLVLEILERSFAETGEDSFVVFEALQNLGAEISIDDFGTGYSALSYFKSIPAKELKIDQSFVLKLLDEKGNLDIVKLIINLAHAFDMRVVAEGVEDYQSFKTLKELGCDYIQGYYLAKPMPHKEFVQWLLDFKGIDIPEEELEEFVPISDGHEHETSHDPFESFDLSGDLNFDDSNSQGISVTHIEEEEEFPFDEDVYDELAEVIRDNEKQDKTRTIQSTPVNTHQPTDTFPPLPLETQTTITQPDTLSLETKTTSVNLPNHQSDSPQTTQTASSSAPQHTENPGSHQSHGFEPLDISDDGLIDLEQLHPPTAPPPEKPQAVVEIADEPDDLEHELEIITPAVNSSQPQTTQSIYHDPTQDSLPKETFPTDTSIADTLAADSLVADSLVANSLAPDSPAMASKIANKHAKGNQDKGRLNEDKLPSSPADKKTTPADLSLLEGKQNDMPGENDIDFGDPLI